MINNAATDPSLKDVIDKLKRDIFISFNCHAIAQIDSFDKDNQTCSVRIMYSKKYSTRTSKGTYVPELVDYPVMTDCPVIVLTGGLAGLTMPIKQGDECLLLFNDRDIDNWFKGAKSGEVATPRAHSMSDAIALVGVRSLQSSIPDYDPDNPVLFNEDAKITMKPDIIRIENSSNLLGVVLQELITAIKNLSTTNCVVGAPVVLAPATITAIETAATKLEGLLE